MVRLVSKAGTHVTVGDELAKVLTRSGWKAETSTEAPPKRKPGRPKKSE